MTEFARDRFDSIICCLQAMPRTLLLVISVLARAATKKAYDYEGSLVKRVLNIPLRFYFEIVLKNDA
ncbi:hypothetical protein NQ318_010823 [Aromia moschata]|uniref:Uncharacterized protein n=1 Tax=Aromia moschata TaxID=1265417 RepID=A0AAV8YHB5_9CUCU|nr:hypothetical protein NQ318_010823 [Aromia moschata]